MKFRFASFTLLLIPAAMVAQNRVGINTVVPKATLHVLKGSIVGTPAPQAVAVFESNTATGISLLAPNEHESGIYFGNQESGSISSIVFNSIVPLGLSFRTGGSIERMTITSSGKVGIGTIAPEDKLHVDAMSGHPFQAQVAGVTRFRVWDNGGVSVGSSSIPPDQGLHVAGPIDPAGGISSTAHGINIESTADSVEIIAGNNRIVVSAGGGIKIVTGPGGGNITIDAGAGNLVLKGLNVTVQATGTANVMGSIVKLNNGTTPVAKLGSVSNVTGSTANIVSGVSSTVFVN